MRACFISLTLLLSLVGGGRALSQPLTFTTLAGSAFTGSDDGTGAGAKFYWPKGVVADNNGNVLVSDTFNHTIRKITAGGVVSTVAGVAGVPGSSDGVGTNAHFYAPQGLALDSAGNLYVADTANHTIRKVTSNGVVSTLAGAAGAVGFLDATGNSAQFFEPRAVAVDSATNVYVADAGNHLIRKINPGGAVTTLAGLPGYSGTLDSNMTNLGTNSARFSSPSGITVDGSGNVFVSDTGNHTIREVTVAGVVSTIAGLPGVWGFADGTNRMARLFQPQGIVSGSAGNLFVNDSGNHVVRKLTLVDTNWVVATIAGLPDVVGNGDGMGAGAQFYYPSGIALSGCGVFAVADSGNNIIRSGVVPSAQFDAIVRLANGSVQLSMSGWPNTNYTLLSGTNVNLAGWDSIAVLPSGNGLFQYTDSSAASNSGRFYRLRLGP